jgi:hypothetical protein
MRDRWAYLESEEHQQKMEEHQQKMEGTPATSTVTCEERAIFEARWLATDHATAAAAAAAVAHVKSTTTAEKLAARKAGGCFLSRANAANTTSSMTALCCIDRWQTLSVGKSAGALRLGPVIDCKHIFA